MSVTIKLADNEEELQQILMLQNSNHIQNLTIKEKEENGFLQVRHDIEMLRKMNDSAQQIIAVDNGIVVGYALVMLKEFSHLIPVLVPMFEMFGSLNYNQKPLNSYYVMGQICISENFRGLGIFEQLYFKHRELYSDKFEVCLTEVSVGNFRSMKAHEKVGFKQIHTFEDNTDTWNILLWDWK